jgi:hypothetical protein
MPISSILQSSILGKTSWFLPVLYNNVPLHKIILGSDSPVGIGIVNRSLDNLFGGIVADYRGPG